MKTVFSIRRNKAALRRLVRGLRRRRDGAVAIEFAIISLPMIAVFIGATLVGSGVMVDRKVTQLTRTLADLTAQVRSGSVSDTDMTDIFGAAQAILAPYDDPDRPGPAMSITSIVIDANRRVSVCWSEARDGGPAFAQGAAYPDLPPSLRVANSSVIVATASYTHKLGKLNFEGLFSNLTEIRISNAPVYMRPRLGQVRNGIEQVAYINDNGSTRMCS